jgi:homocitrate synthase NifV
MPGVVFNRKEKIAILDLLARIGVPEAEIGTPAMGNEAIADMRVINNQGFGIQTLAWCRALKTDIDMAAKSGTDGVHISFPVSAIHLETMGKDETWVLNQMHQIIPLAANNFSYITIGAQDASRADYRFLKEFISNLSIYEIKRVRIADTVGIFNPFSTAELIARLKNDFPDISFEFHAHNDLGMATANSLAAYRAGAICINTTVDGLGERAGNTAMEEFVLAVQLSLGINWPVGTELFTELSSLVAKASGIPVPVNKPVIGPGVLRHESGIHTNLLLKNRQTYQIITAASIGRTEKEFIFGKHSGINALKAFMEKHQIKAENNLCNLLIGRIRSESARMKRNLTEKELIALINHQYSI